MRDGFATMHKKNVQVFVCLRVCSWMVGSVKELKIWQNRVDFEQCKHKSTRKPWHLNFYICLTYAGLAGVWRLSQHACRSHSGFQSITGCLSIHRQTMLFTPTHNLRVCKSASLWTTGGKWSTWDAHEFSDSDSDSTNCCRNYSYLCNLTQWSSYWVTKIPKGLQWGKNTWQPGFVSRKLCHVPLWIWRPWCLYQIVSPSTTYVPKMCFL